jgi:hypothetical protein
MVKCRREDGDPENRKYKYNIKRVCQHSVIEYGRRPEAEKRRRKLD